MVLMFINAEMQNAVFLVLIWNVDWDAIVHKDLIVTINDSKLKSKSAKKKKDAENLFKTQTDNADKIINRYKHTLDEIEEFCIVYSSNHDAYETVYKHILNIINKAKEKNNG